MRSRQNFSFLEGLPPTKNQDEKTDWQEQKLHSIEPKEEEKTLGNEEKFFQDITKKALQFLKFSEASRKGSLRLEETAFQNALIQWGYRGIRINDERLQTRLIRNIHEQLASASGLSSRKPLEVSKDILIHFNGARNVLDAIQSITQEEHALQEKNPTRRISINTNDKLDANNMIDLAVIYYEDGEQIKIEKIVFVQVKGSKNHLDEKEKKAILDSHKAYYERLVDSDALEKIQERAEKETPSSTLQETSLKEITELASDQWRDLLFDIIAEADKNINDKRIEALCEKYGLNIIRVATYFKLEKSQKLFDAVIDLIGYSPKETETAQVIKQEFLRWAKNYHPSGEALKLVYPAKKIAKKILSKDWIRGMNFVSTIFQGGKKVAEAKIGAGNKILGVEKN